MQGGQRPHRGERSCHRAQERAGAVDASPRSANEPPPQAGHALTGGRHLRRGADASEQSALMRQARVRRRKMPAQRRGQARFQFVGAQHALFQRTARMHQALLGGGQQTPIHSQPRRKPRRDGAPQRGDAGQRRGGVRRDQLGGGGWRGGAFVSSEIGQRHVGFVADGGHHRDPAGGDAAHHGLVVERGEILERTAAPGDEDHVRRMAHPLGAIQRPEDLPWSVEPLHRHIETGHPHAGKPPPQHGQHVAQHGAGARGHHRDVVWKRRQRAFAFVREQPGGGELRLEALERGAQRALARQLHVIDDDLEVAAAFVDREASGNHHAGAIGQADAHEAVAGCEHDAPHAGALIFQAEIPVPRGVGPEIGNLAFDPHAAEAFLDGDAGLGSQLAHRVHESAAGSGGGPGRRRRCAF